MQYLGGKSRIAKLLAEVIDRHRQPGQLVWDAFCGGLSMSVALRKKGPVWSTDANVALISLYRAVQNGWDPPTELSKETWTAAKALPDSDPMKAFCGFGCSFGGKWFGGFSAPRRGSGWSAAGQGRVLRRDASPSCIFDLVDFNAVEPRQTAAILYLDPPYAGVSGYAGVWPFNHELFVERVRGWAKHTHVFVSEYSFSLGTVVFEGASKTKLNGGMSGRALNAIERLYHLHPGNL